MEERRGRGRPKGSRNKDRRPSEIAEAVRRYALDGLTGIQVAEALGVSRQRVSQIAKTHGIQLRRHVIKRWGVYHSKPRPPLLKVVTGGVPIRINTNAAGTIAELLVAADLIARGWLVYMPIVLHRGHDIVAAYKERIITVEVRPGRRRKNGGVSYSKNLNSVVSQHYGIVVTGEPAVVYEPELPNLGE